MSDLNVKAAQVAVLKTLADKVAEVDKPARAELLADMREIGAEKVNAKLPDGTVVASVSIAGGQGPKAFIADEQAFLNWVKKNRPTEVEERVSDAFKKRFLDELAKTGETVPGIDLADSRPYISTRFAPGGKDAITEAWTSGDLQLGQLLALPSGGAS